MSEEFTWYQCKLEMFDGKTLRGIRSIAKSKSDFKKRMEETCEDILAKKGIVYVGLIKNVFVEEVPEDIKSMYNLNDKNDYNRFLNYIDDDCLSNSTNN